MKKMLSLAFTVRVRAWVCVCEREREREVVFKGEALGDGGQDS